MGIKNSKLPWFETSYDGSVEFCGGRTLNITISIIFLTYNEVKFVFVVGTVSDCFLTKLRKEILALAF